MPPLPISQELENIRATGDVIDQDSRHSLPIGRLAATATYAAAIIPSALDERLYSPSYLLSAPVYAAGLSVVTAGIYARIRQVQAANAQSAERSQVYVREVLKEPVDVMRIGRKKSRQLLMRWYGAEGADDNTVHEMTLRLRKIVDFIEHEKIEKLALGADWLKEIVGDEAKETPYGEISSGSRFVTTEKGKHNIVVSDLQADSRVIVTTREQARLLVERLERTETQETVNRLMAHVTDEVVTRTYRAFSDSKMSSQDFKKYVRMALEREYNVQTSPAYRHMHDDYGVPRRQRITPTATIVGDRVRIMDNWTDDRSGETRQDVGEGVSLLRAQGVETLDDLLTKIDSETRNDQRVVLSSLYLTLLRAEDERRSPRAFGTASSAREKTLFERMQIERLKTFPKLRPHSPYEGEATVEYIKKEKVPAVILGCAALMHANFVGGMVGGAGNIYNDHLESAQKNRYQYQLEQATNDRKYYDQKGNFDRARFENDYRLSLERAGISFDRQYLEAYDSFVHFNDNLESYMMDKYLVVLGPVIEPIGDFLDEQKFDAWGKNVFKILPSEILTASSGKSFIGDAGQKDGVNETIYSIQRLNQEVQTEGYWYGATFSGISLESEGLQFNGPERVDSYNVRGKKDELEHVFVSGDSAEINNTHPDFMVTTSYLQNEKDHPLRLPIRQGYEIIGLQVVDLSNPSRNMPLPTQLQRFSQSGTYQLTMDKAVASQIYEADIKVPQLRYWIKRTLPSSMAPEVTIRSVDHMTYPVGTNTMEITKTVKQALGLAETATDLEVYEKIKDSKYYSLTPLQDAHKDLKKSSGEDPTAALSELGSTLAELESLNCNLASALFLLGTQNSVSDTSKLRVNLATGFYDSGDGLLTQREAHAWAVTDSGFEIDATPSSSNERIDVSPRSAEVPAPAKIPYNRIAQGMLGAAFLIMAYRRREQIKRHMDQTRSYYITHSKTVPGAISLIEAAAYGKSNSKPKKRDLSPQQVRSAILNNIPIGGYSPREIRAQLAQKNIRTRISPITQLALSTLWRNDHAIRRAANRPTNESAS